MKTYQLNGKWSTKKEIDATEGAKFIKNKKFTIDEDTFETPEYTAKQHKNSIAFFNKLAEDREELEKRHG